MNRDVSHMWLTCEEIDQIIHMLIRRVQMSSHVNRMSSHVSTCESDMSTRESNELTYDHM